MEILKVRNEYYSGYKNTDVYTWYPSYEYSETIPDGGIGETVEVPGIPNESTVSCIVIAGAGIGKIQFTLSPIKDAYLGLATWSDWPRGDITGTDHDTLIGPVTAVRGVSISGEIRIEVVS